jgi:hypothetical protein
MEKRDRRSGRKTALQALLPLERFYDLDRLLHVIGDMSDQISEIRKQRRSRTTVVMRRNRPDIVRSRSRLTVTGMRRYEESAAG